MNLVISLAIFLAGFGAAWSWQGARSGLALADLRARHSDQALDAATAAARRIKEKADLADTITRDRTRREAALDRQLQEARHALKSATLGRPCLGGAALRLLDQSPGLRPDAEPAPAGTPDRGSAGSATDSTDEEDEASDTDVAEWIVTAGRYYARCRGRLADIRRYEAEP